MGRIISGYPNHTLEKFSLSFTLGKNVKNADLIFAVIESLMESDYSVDNNSIVVTATDENTFIDNMDKYYDLLIIAGSWKSFNISINGATLDRLGFNYLLSFYSDKHGIHKHLRKSIQEIKRHYFSGKRKPTKKIDDDVEVAYISKKDPKAALDAAINKYIELYCKNKSISYYSVSPLDTVLNIEDSLIVDFRVMPRYWTRINDENERDWDFPYIIIQELCHNDLFKFNFQGYKRCFKYDYIGIEDLRGLDTT